MGVKKLSWLDDMEAISDTDNGEKIERTRGGYRKRKAVGGGEGWKRKETGQQVEDNEVIFFKFYYLLKWLILCP